MIFIKNMPFVVKSGLFNQNFFMKVFPRTMQDTTFISWHIVRMYLALEITNTKFIDQWCLVKIWLFLWKVVYLTENVVANFYQTTRHNLHLKSLIIMDWFKGI